MNRLKLIIITSIIGVGIIGTIASCSKDVNLITKSFALDEVDKNVEEDENDKIKEADIIKNGNLINLAKDYAVSASEVSRILDNPYQGSEKQIFLTFDDGPSECTDKVLEILEEKEVNGTFFILGDSLEKENAKERVKSIIEKGNAIANHTYTHDYKKLYPNGKVDVTNFMKEIDATNEQLKKMLGETFNTDVIRMPSGHMTREYYKDPNLNKLDDTLKTRGIVQIDWTAENGDGVTKKESLDKMLGRVYDQVKEQKSIVLLMHDSKGKDLTVEALPVLIDYFKEQGFKFKVIANDNILN
ncbi:MAG: polysaccharide deacetylase family protein [Sarcina sp.]